MASEQVLMGKPVHVCSQEHGWTSPWGKARFVEIWYEVVLTRDILAASVALKLYAATYGHKFDTQRVLFGMN
jgi:hypothetical protein